MSRFTETAAKHTFAGRSAVYPPVRWALRCSCGWVLPVEEGTGSGDKLLHAAHVESMLVEAGVVAVELPEWTKSEWSLRGIWHTASGDDVWAKTDGTIGHDGGDSSDSPAVWYHPHEAESLAAALLAASAAAVRPATPEEPR